MAFLSGIARLEKSCCLLMNGISDLARDGNCSLLLEIRENLSGAHLSRQRFIFVYSHLCDI